MRDHGGNIDAAIQTYGGAAADWIDLSTGINRAPYPVPPLSAAAWTGLPTRAAIASLHDVARTTWGITGAVLAVSGAQTAIQLIPRLSAPAQARVLAPTYNEHAASLRAAGWQVTEVSTLSDLAGADLAVVVNPNNPDGNRYSRAALLALLPKVGRLLVDESFADPQPAFSLCGETGRAGLLVLRSFGKFYGLAGVRLGFIAGSAPDIATLSEMSGPWPVSGAAIEIGIAALSDTAWQAATTARLTAEAAQLDALATAAGWTALGGTELFRLYDTPDAAQAQNTLAAAHIWSRIFPYSARWLRLGLPAGDAEWARVTEALARQPQ
jgi:cobalamin biosynthetic protein CobC